MKKTRIAVVLAVALVASLGAQSALAWGHGGPRVSIGFGFGVPFAPYPYYYPPYYAPYAYPAYYPPVVQQPTVYVEQPAQQQFAPAAPQQQMQGSWYYCAASRAYYPYVKDCPSGWQRVAPQPG